MSRADLLNFSSDGGRESFLRRYRANQTGTAYRRKKESRPLQVSNPLAHVTPPMGL